MKKIFFTTVLFVTFFNSFSQINNSQSTTAVDTTNTNVNSISGKLVVNFLPKATASAILGNSSIFDNGNVGIGTTSPLNKFHIQAGGTSLLTSIFGDGMIFSSNNVAGTRFFIENLAAPLNEKTSVIYSQNGLLILGGVLSDNGGTWKHLAPIAIKNASGFVGINTNNPLYNLDVSGNVRVSSSLIASSFIKQGGTATQFLKADGSVDNIAYAPLTSPNFSGIPVVPTAIAGTNTTQIATTAFVTNAIASSSIPDATATVKGKIQLAGDLTGTASAPVVANNAITNAKIANGISATKVGLGNVDNTSDINKPISTATQTALNGKANDSGVVHLAGTETITGSKTFSSNLTSNATIAGLTLASQGNGLLMKMDTSDWTGPRLSLGTPTNPKAFLELAAYDGMNNLDTKTRDFKVFSTASPIAFVLKGSTGLIGINTLTPTERLDVNGNIKANSFMKRNGTSSQFLKADGSVDTILYAPLTSPNFSGIPLAPTAITGTNTTQIATTAFVTNAVASVAITDATATVKGKIQLAGDLTGTASAPIVANNAITDAKIANGISATKVGLGNVDNTSDINKPISTATQTALNLKANLASPTFTGTVSGITKAMVGLGNVDNTSDANKPVSTATQAALNAKQATLVSGTSIKTINGNSLLGSGDIAISGGSLPVLLEFNDSEKTIWNNGKNNISENTGFGDSVLKSITTGSFNAVFGYRAGQSMTTGAQNTAIGNNSLSGNISGLANVAIGSNSLVYSTSSYNNAVGYQALQSQTTGDYNTGLGFKALFANQTGFNNVAIGYNSLGYIIGASNNVGLGNNAGANATIGTITSSSNSVFVGTSSKAEADSQTNQIVIGFNAIGAGSNTATLGNTAITKTILRGEVQGGSFKKVGGLSTEYLMADGSVSTGASGEAVITPGTTSQYWRGDKTWQSLDKTAVGIGNVDNTSDINKPISTATQTALDLKANLASPIFTGTVSGITKAMVGLSNVDNTTDAAKPISTATQTALNAKQDTLVSGTSIKTINGNSLLGSGDIAVTANTGSLEFNTTEGTVWNNGKNNISSNTSFGERSLINNITGHGNTAYGYWCLGELTEGEANTAIGNEALTRLIIASRNIGIGLWAGKYFGDGAGAGLLTGAEKSIFIGTASRPQNNNSINEIVIGDQALGAGSNTATLGNTSITKTILRGEVLGGSFKKEGGTSSQYLMADGSVSTGASGEAVITPGTTSQYWRGDKTWQTLNKTAVGLGNVDNTTDANKPISTATQTALDTKQATLVSGTNIKTINGTSLLGSGDITVSGGGSFVDLTTNQTIAGTKTFSSLTKFGNTTVNSATSSSIIINNTTFIEPVNTASNVAIGRGANDNGYSNTKIGFQAGQHSLSSVSGGTLTISQTSNNGVYIGNSCLALTNNSTNQIVIGSSALGAGSNTATLGNTAITKTILRGEVQGGSFKKVGGLSTEYLMADGSVSTGALGEAVITPGTTSQYWRGDKTWQTLNKASVGLGNVDNTTDANKPISTATQLALDGKQNTLTNPITGTGTTNYISKFTASGTLSDSSMYDNGGNVGIGTTAPDAKLAVKGQIHAQEVKVDLQGAMVPDYVFAKEYKLKSLSEVDAYIKANSHLPEVPSAQEIEKNGLQLGEMNMVLLKKIEELTLHAIEQQKQIERLKTENETYKTFAERLAIIEKKLKK